MMPADQIKQTADRLREMLTQLNSTAATYHTLQMQIDAATTRLDSERVALLRRALEAASTPSDHARVLAVLASELAQAAT